MARWPKPVEGTWTEHYRDLGTGPISFEDSISPEFYDLERLWRDVPRVAWEPVGARGGDLPPAAFGEAFKGLSPENLLRTS